MPYASYKSKTGNPLLSLKQKTALAVLARQAWEKGGHAARSEAESGAADPFGMAPPESKRFDEWRHAEALRCCGRRIAQATNNDYRRLANWFMALSKPAQPFAPAKAAARTEPATAKTLLVAGEARAFSADRSAQGSKVQALLVDNGLTWAYADAIAERMYGIARVEWCRSIELRGVITALVKRKHPSVSEPAFI